LNNSEKFQLPEIKRTPSRFRNPIGKYRLNRSMPVSPAVNAWKYATMRCMWRDGAGCSLKTPIVAWERTVRIPAWKPVPEQALTLKRNTDFEVLGDRRWPADLLVSSWHMAEFGRVPEKGLECKIGDSDGGFDKLRIAFKKARSVRTRGTTMIWI
jgi:hypothetical protein